jgi:PAS domain S-box-containing protein
MMAGFPRLTLAARVMLGAAVFIVLAATASTYYVVEAERAAYLGDRGAALENRAERNAERLRLSIDALRRDVLFLARTPPVQGIIRATRNAGFDAEGNTGLDGWKERLGELFSAFADARPQYFQLRYIGVADNGRELVRVETEDGRVVVTPPEKLQAKGDHNYFQATLNLKAGDVYLSEIDLNEEWGKVQVPHIRTLRASTPVFTADGTLFGMVVINLDVGTAIDSATMNLPPGFQAYLMNSEGDYLAHPDPGRAFGFLLGQRYTWKQDMPGLQVPSTPGAGGVSLQSVSTPAGLIHVAVERLQLDAREPDRSLLLAYALPDAFVEARLAGVRNTTIFVMVTIALSVGAVVFLLLRQVFAPLTRLTALAGNIGAGRYDIALPSEGIGELGSFIRAFRTMLDGISAREQEVRQANATIQQSEARLQTTLENLAEGVVVSDLNGQLLYFNPAAVEMHGFTSTDEYLRRLPEFADTFELSALDGTAWSVDQWPLARILRGETLRDLDVCIRRIRTTGWQRIFSYGGALARDADSQPLLAVVTIRDITERKQVEERVRTQRERAEALLEATPDPVVIVNHSGQIVLINGQAEKVFGYARSELLGQPVEKLLPERFREAHIGHRRAYSEAPSIRPMGMGRELNARRKDGSEFPVDISLSPLETPEGTLVISNIRDITVRKRAEEALAQQTEELRRSNAELEQFAYVASHDLQEPLRAVTGMVQLLLQRYQGKLDARADEFVTHAVEGAARMQALINDLLAFSRVGTRGEDIQPTDASTILTSVLANLAVAIRESQAVVSYDALPLVTADPTQMTQLLQNLISNGIKFRSEQPPKIHVGAERRESEWVFSVRDNGIGIEPQYFDRIFGVFQRLHTRREYPGTGIGLAICKKIVERHGGRIWVESEPGQGSTFLFTIPDRRQTS